MTTIHAARPAGRLFADVPAEFAVSAQLDLGEGQLTILSRPVDAMHLEIRLLLDDVLVAAVIVADMPGSEQWDIAAVHAWVKGPWMEMLVAHAQPAGEAEHLFGTMGTAQSSRDLDPLFW